MRLWALVVHIYALIYLPVEDVESRSTDVASDANVIRTGRSTPSYTASDELENSHDTSTKSEISKPDDFSRSLRGRDSFIRFGRDRNDNFMRFGRGAKDNFMRFGRSYAIEKGPDEKADGYERSIRSGKGNKKSVSDKFERLTKNFIRLGRGSQDNFMRFGKGKQDNFMRFGRGKQDNFMRFGRGKQDNFMRFGRGKQDNFMRFGRGKQDNFMRFGRGKESNYMRFGRNIEQFYEPLQKDKLDFNVLLGDSTGKHDSFGRHFMGSFDDTIPIAMRSSSLNYNSFDHFGKSKQDNALRVGTSYADKQSPQPFEFSEDLKNHLSYDTDGTTPLRDTFTRVMKSKLFEDVNLLRQGRHPPSKDDSFIRFGRSSLDSLNPNLNPVRVKRSAVELDEGQEDMFPSKIHEGIRDRILLPVLSLTDYRDEDIFSSDQPEDFNNRRKRYVPLEPPPSLDDEVFSSDDVSSKLLLDREQLYKVYGIPLFIGPAP